MFNITTFLIVDIIEKYTYLCTKIQFNNKIIEKPLMSYIHKSYNKFNQLFLYCIFIIAVINYDNGMSYNYVLLYLLKFNKFYFSFNLYIYSYIYNFHT